MINDVEKRVFWSSSFKNSDQLYMLDGAIVKYNPTVQGVYYEHHLIRDNMCIFEKPMDQFYGLPVGETVEFMLEAEDDGLFSFLEIRFIKHGSLIFKNFSSTDSKLVQCVVPDYDDFKVRVHIRGEGSTRLLNVTARVLSLKGFIFTGDKQLSSLIGVKEVIGDGKELLVTFSNGLSYMRAEFFTFNKPQVHFASINGDYDDQIILNYLHQNPLRRLEMFQVPQTILKTLSNSDEYDIIKIIE